MRINLKINQWRKWLCALLAALMVFAGCGSLAEPVSAALQEQMTFEGLTALGAKAAVHDGRVTFVDGACTNEPIVDSEGAARVVSSMMNLMGGDERTRFEPWRTLTDARGNRYYVFHQTQGETTVPGGAVKVVTDAEGRMMGLVASVESGLPDVSESEGISAEQAEEQVLQYLRDHNQARAELAEGRTERIILPVKLDIDPDSTDEIADAQCHYVWAVYTTNPEEKNVEHPFLAHYVTMNGDYLYSLPTILPGDEAGSSGYNAAYAFENMEAVDYTGKVTLSDGTEREITVSLMRDRNTGKYYLANLERRIAVADCYEFIYNKGHVVLEESEDNTGWDNTCLLSLYNYCKAWDYYHEMGWNGADGLGTPILILKDYCNRDHQPLDNAAYAGKYYGWQAFLSSGINDLSQCLDVLAHEFSHCVTGSVMTYNAYMNDYGAINEAISDIHGNICEMMAGETEDTTWLLGENSKNSAFRSMSDPHAFRQPEYLWDLYYTPNVKSPTDTNDRGGVHSNSSLLNNVAYRLCAEGGMTLEEARSFWFAVDCAMTPGTDYPMLSEMLPWVLKNQGMEKYEKALEDALNAVQLRSEAEPEKFGEDRAMVTLTLPEDERFQDGNWGLMIFSVDVDAIRDRMLDILERRGEHAVVLDELMVALGLDPTVLPTEEEVARDPDHAWDRFGSEIVKVLDDNGNGEPTGIFGMEKSAELFRNIGEHFSDTIYLGQGFAGEDGRTIRLVCQPGKTLPILYRLEFDNDLHILSTGFAAYVFGAWMDLGPMVIPLMNDFIASVNSGADSTVGNQQTEPDLSWLEELFDTGNEETAEETARETTKEAEQTESDLSWLDALFGLGSEGATEETTKETAKEAEQTEPDLSWLGALFDIGNEGAAEEASGEMTRMDTGFLDLIWGMLKEMLFWKINPGEVNTLPSTGLDQVTILDAKDYPSLNALFLDQVNVEEQKEQ